MRWWLLVIVLLGILVALVAARELRRQSTAPVAWSTDGGELGRRVRSGAVPGVQHLTFRSEAIGEEIGVVIANPVSDAPRETRVWPVVYFLNGFGSDEWALFAAGPELVSELRREAIVVGVNQGHSSGYGDAETMLAREVVRLVDERRATVTAPAGRALVGHSLGGMAALYVGTRHPETFGLIGAFSSACYLVDHCDEITEEVLRTLADPTAGLERTAFVVSWGTAEDNRIVDFQERVSTSLTRDLHGRIQRFVLEGVDHDFAEQLAFGPPAMEPFSGRIAASLRVGLAAR